MSLSLSAVGSKVRVRGCVLKPHDVAPNHCTFLRLALCGIVSKLAAAAPLSAALWHLTSAVNGDPPLHNRRI
jgi:hypothetical protein